MKKSSITQSVLVICCLFCLSSCNDGQDTYTPLSEEVKFRFTSGYVLVYYSNAGETDSLYVHSRASDYWSDACCSQMGPYAYYEMQIVILSGENAKSSHQDDSLYCSFYTYGDSPSFDLILEDSSLFIGNIYNESSINIFGIEYFNIHTFEFDTVANDSMIAKRYVFCPQYGIIQYELLNGDIYSYSHFILPPDTTLSQIIADVR